MEIRCYQTELAPTGHPNVIMRVKADPSRIGSSSKPSRCGRTAATDGDPPPPPPKHLAPEKAQWGNRTFWNREITSNASCSLVSHERRPTEVLSPWLRVLIMAPFSSCHARHLLGVRAHASAQGIHALRGDYGLTHSARWGYSGVFF